MHFLPQKYVKKILLWIICTKVTHFVTSFVYDILYYLLTLLFFVEGDKCQYIYRHRLKFLTFISRKRFHPLIILGFHYFAAAPIHDRDLLSRAPKFAAPPPPPPSKSTLLLLSCSSPFFLFLDIRPFLHS